ncbi:ADP-ribosylation factor-like protein 13B [Halotydeus destructor]|nr:ADP-ribosylation factor-like protein 13B [Halotydeus destructor]
MGSVISSPLSLCRQTSVSQNLPSTNNQSRPTMRILLIGLDNAGKTTTVMHLLGNPVDDIVPTVGFSTVEMKQFKKCKVQIYDLGGGAKIRSIWTNYFALVHGIIYVVDSSDGNRINQVKETLFEVISHERVQRKPILILINKQDIENSIEEADILKQLDVESLINKYECPTRIEPCSALANYDSKRKHQRDPGIDQGYHWLVNHIVRNWHELADRVARESDQQIEIEKKVMKERFRRYRAKAEEQVNHNLEHLEHSDAGNPFKPINEVIMAATNGERVAYVPTGPVQDDLETELTICKLQISSQDVTSSPSKHLTGSSPKQSLPSEREQDTAGDIQVKCDFHSKIEPTESRGKQGPLVGDRSMSRRPESSKSTARRDKCTVESTKLRNSSSKSETRSRTIFRSNKVSPIT